MVKQREDNLQVQTTASRTLYLVGVVEGALNAGVLDTPLHGERHIQVVRIVGVGELGTQDQT